MRTTAAGIKTDETFGPCISATAEPDYEEPERRIGISEAILNACGEAILCVDGARKILWANRSAAEAVGLTPEKVIGGSCAVFSRARHLCPSCSCDATFATGEAQQELVGMESDREGKAYWHCATTPLQDEHRRVIGVVRTSRRIGSAIAQAEFDQDGCRFLAEKTPLPYHSLNHAGELLDVNAAWLHLLGFGREEVIGRRLADFLPASRQCQFEENFALLRRAGRISKTKMVLVAKSGAAVQVIVEGRVRFGPDGSFRQTHCLLYHLDGDPRPDPAAVLWPAAGGGLLPICSSCKDIRDSDENWHRPEIWFGRHLGVEFSHSLCPHCLKKLYPEHY